MTVTAQTALFVGLLCFSVSALSTTVQRCEDSAGKLTFTYQGCPSGSSMQFQKAYNAAPGSQSMPAPESYSGMGTQYRLAARDPVIVGQRDDGCGNQITSDQRRRAIIDKRVLGGMSLRDVQSALGKPDKIIRRNGEIRYIYDEKKGSSTRVDFNEDKCVKAKSKTAKSPH